MTKRAKEIKETIKKVKDIDLLTYLVSKSNTGSSMAMGRPKKYKGGHLMNVSIAMPQELLAQVEDMRGDRNRNETLIFMLTSADKELTKNLMKQFDETRKLLNDTLKTNKELAEQLNKQSSNFNSLINIYTQIPPNNEITEIVKGFKNEYIQLQKRGASRFDARDTITAKILVKLEEEALKRGETISKKNMAKIMIEKELALL